MRIRTMPKDSNAKVAPSKPKLQFGVRNLLIASTCLAVWLTLCGLFRIGAPPPWLPEILSPLIPLGVVSLPFFAIGSLVGRGETRFLIGIIVFVLMILLPTYHP